MTNGDETKKITYVDLNATDIKTNINGVSVYITLDNRNQLRISSRREITSSRAEPHEVVIGFKNA